ncbi:MAG TPA: serine hydrolase, partial [Rhodoferax sp.]
GANVSVGRGTEHPFEWLGAPWIAGPQLANALNDAAMPGLVFTPIDFTPDAGPYRRQPCHGVQIRVLDRERLDAPLLGALLVRTLAQLWPDTFELGRTQALVGSQETLEELRAGVDVATIASHWQPGLAAFHARRERYLLY